MYLRFHNKNVSRPSIASVEKNYKHDCFQTEFSFCLSTCKQGFPGGLSSLVSRLGFRKSMTFTGKVIVR